MLDTLYNWISTLRIPNADKCQSESLGSTIDEYKEQPRILVIKSIHGFTYAVASYFFSFHVPNLVNSGSANGWFSSHLHEVYERALLLQCPETIVLLYRD